MKKAGTRDQTKSDQTGRGRTDVEGQNPKANDSPEHDEHHDESRHNPFEPEVTEVPPAHRRAGIAG